MRQTKVPAPFNREQKNHVKAWVRTYIRPRVRAVFLSSNAIIAFSDDPLPTTTDVWTPMGSVLVPTLTVDSKQVYDLFVKVWALPLRQRIRVLIRYPELSTPEVPTKKRLDDLLAFLSTEGLTKD